MKKSKFNETQINAILKQIDGGLSIVEYSRQHGNSDQSIYRWRAKDGDMEPNAAKRLKSLEDENRKLKRLVADLSLDHVSLVDALSGHYDRP